MASHLVILVVFSAFVAVVFGALLRETIDAQVKLAGKLFAALVASAVVLGWLMYPFPF